jgi:hypothetical protein
MTAAAAIGRPDATEYAPAFANYVNLVPAGDVQVLLEQQLAELTDLLSPVSEAESLVRHTPYTWSVKEVLGHITDCERIFGHRALRIARNDATPLSSFDENAYMTFATFDRVPFAELLAEFQTVRRSHLYLFRHLEPAAWTRRGIVNNHPATPRAFAFVIVGHARHHLDILRTRLA